MKGDAVGGDVIEVGLFEGSLVGDELGLLSYHSLCMLADINAQRC